MNDDRKKALTSRSPQKPADARPKRGHGAKPEAVRGRAVLALLTAKTVTDAVKKAGVDESTLRRWLADDGAFKADYAAARQVAFEVGMTRIEARAGKAVDALDDLLDAKHYPNVRLGAARTVAELAIHQHDAATILKKLGEIEAGQRRQQGR